ncbi:MAG: ribonuclease Y [Candidatus Magasanikbacteria bacterium]|jgi:ribonucrease Y|nr:ribonuclease Y [Candidatus Magasanikbacteria bacterium]MBT5820290.1 ribonuclease Y [Candidatus Magasanikbacteria bacterium]MBT6294868.1 ribonuclease Y [Candidatus Magasanikbacteria bacterium]
MIEIIIAAVSIIVGSVGGYFWRKNTAQANANSIEAVAENRLIEAKNKEKDLLLKAKEQAIKIIDDAKKEEEVRRKDIEKMRTRIEDRESMFDKKISEFDSRKTKLEEKVKEIQEIKVRVDEVKEKAQKQLEIVSRYSKEEAKEKLIEQVEQESKEDLLHHTLKLDKKTREEVEEKAKSLVIGAMQRTACNHAAETTGTMFQLPSEEMKGRIIGKEGRNIKTIEKMTGCELIIDETPEMLIISSFSPIRRRVCQLTLERLITDGRIQPAKIEEYIDNAKKELAIDLRKTGEETLHKMGIIGIDPKLVSIVGRLKYRTSYGQNVLNHCTEVGYLSALLAEEVGMDPAKAKKAGFFHDIGKAIDHETQGSHTEIGHTILKKFNVDDDTAEVALTHHDTNPPLLLTKLCMAADAISASRVGARRDTFEQYVARLEELESTAKDFPGVDKVYAIQAGREVRIFVNPKDIDDYQSYTLAKDIARKIESELQYPGEIKVNVIRENRTIEYAR